MMYNIEQQVKQRIMNQLVTSIIYEDVVQYEVTQQGATSIVTIEAEDATYRAEVRELDSFQRLELTSPVWRITDDGDTAVTVDYATMLREVIYTFDKNNEKVEAFINELLQTDLKDTQAMRYKEMTAGSVELTFDALESYAMEGHPYHPSYKSRLGFTPVDNLQYGPDFQPTFTLKWLAIPKHYIEQTVSRNIEAQDLLQQQLGDEVVQQFKEVLLALDKSLADYEWLPVHPWQFDHIIASELAEQWINGEIILLGESEEYYTPQQSIRTLSPVDTSKYYIKVPLSITNTSTKRVLAPHTIENAAQITDWLKHIHEQDSYLNKELKTVFLGEILGMSYINDNLTESKREAIYGAVSVIWRENLHSYLTETEDAIPFNAIYSLDQRQNPIIQQWIAQYGVAAWVRQFIKVAVQPIIHMLYYHGIALESHAQNMMLIHEDGWPTRVAIKDFHDGVRFKRGLLSTEAQNPQLKDTPEEHKKINRNSFIETEDVELVRDFTLDAFFFINISEIIMFFERHYNLSEHKQWMYVYDEIKQYRQTHPDLPNYEHFDLFEKTIQVEKLTTRRLLEDTEIRIHHVTNPLGVIHHDDVIPQR
ncbi:siderophore biosynthesis protein SbnF [Staphylococcus equorum subsp. linens]|nr:siderophore biosynthesis protein SbnF [Staphylococcus equorum subsp. linens]PTE88180.1 staphyloferrin B biosynthesis protein SbnF [Staphylococcus equorum]